MMGSTRIMIIIIIIIIMGATAASLISMIAGAADFLVKNGSAGGAGAQHDHAAAALLLVLQDVVYLYSPPLVISGLYLGMVSGYIPSPLYERGQTWPLPYVVFQLVLLVLTLLRIHWGAVSSGGDEETTIDETAGGPSSWSQQKNIQMFHQELKEMSKHINWWASPLHIFYEKPLEGLRNISPVLLWFPISWGILKATESGGGIMMMMMMGLNKNKTKKRRRTNEDDDHNSRRSSMGVIFLRNMLLYVSFTTFSIWDDDDSFKFCEEHGIKPDSWVAPNYPLSQLAYDFAAAWKRFHPSHYGLLRITHALLYPPVLLLLTRRKLSHFFIWFFFVEEMDVFRVSADMWHYVLDDGADLAEQRSDFQDEARACYINVCVIQTMLAYPLNFLFLTTSFGDTELPHHDGTSTASTSLLLGNATVCSS